MDAFGFKEILWDSGAVWIVVLCMFLGWIFTTIKEWLGARIEY
jgi:hypothetical protein